MKKSLKKWVALVLSAGMIISANAPIMVGAEESTDETTEVSEEVSEESAVDAEEEVEEDTEDVAEDATEGTSQREANDQPYTEEELSQYILPYSSYDPNNVIETDALKTIIDDMNIIIQEDATELTYEKIKEIAGEPNSEDEVGSSKFLTYVGISEKEVIILDIQTFDNENGDGYVISNFTVEYRTPKMFQQFGIYEEDLMAFTDEDLSVESLQELLGFPELIEVYPDIVYNEDHRSTYTWIVSDNPNIPDDEIVGITGDVVDGVLTNVQYILMSDLNEDEAEASDESVEGITVDIDLEELEENEENADSEE